VIAVDTNVVVRLVTGDDADQVARAAALFAREQIFFAKTVIIETEWVLRRLYGLPMTRVMDALTELISLPNTQTEDIFAVINAILWARQGVDFADALHVASSREAEGFATFDVDLLKRARSLFGIPLIQP
jgi:predicted nucleic-acid-binding protein